MLSKVNAHLEESRPYKTAVLSPESYIVDAEGEIRSVVLDYEQFRKLEDLILDLGLAQAMEEVEDDDEVGLEEAKKLAGYSQ